MSAAQQPFEGVSCALAPHFGPANIQQLIDFPISRSEVYNTAYSESSSGSSMSGYPHIAQPSPVVRAYLSFLPVEWVRLGGLYGFIVLLHALGWGLYLHFSSHYPALIGLGFVAYLFGLRHAFDADHIAAIDDTLRYMLQKGKQPLGVGFFFSLGHSTIVFGLAIAIAFAATAVERKLPQLQNLGGVIGASVSGVFLWLVGILNLLVLLDIFKIWRQAKKGAHSHTHLEALLARRGLLNRLFQGRLQNLMKHSWQMYPLGLL
jgi:nickel/cobalt transporter (NiCoT) family protein